MASEVLRLLLLSTFTSLLTIAFSIDVMHPFTCSQSIINVTACKALLYHANNSLSEKQIASFYAVDESQIKPIAHLSKQDYLLTVPCSCQDINGTVAYFYDVSYTVKQNDTFLDVSNDIYSGQVWGVGGEEKLFLAGSIVPLHLLCGCVENEAQTVVTYTVQQGDNLLDIATLLSSNVSEIMTVNNLPNANFIDVGWVLFVPMENH